MRLTVLALLAAAPLALAQTPPAPTPGNISVDAVEVVRQKPDMVKLYMKVEARNEDAKVAADEAADEAKKMADGLGKLKVDGMTVATLQQRTIRSEVLGRGGVPGGGVQGVVDYRVIKPLVVSVTASDADKFTAAVEKVQVEAFKLGLVSDLANDNYSYTPGGQEKNSPFRAVYGRKAGWEELTPAALEKATKKARAKAEALAAGSGVKLGDVVSVTETSGYSGSSGYNPYGTVATPAEPEDELVDGELVRKIRVRVVFATSK